jgi:serine/threonine-protein kinase SRPK3
MLDKLAFGISKIDGEGSKPGSVGSTGAIVPRETMGEMNERARDAGAGNETDEAADRLSNMSIDSNEFDKKAKPPRSNPHGPSLLTQMAPSHSGATISSSNTGHVDNAIRLDGCHVRRTVIHVCHVH